MAAIPAEFDLETTEVAAYSAYTTLWEALKGTDLAHLQPGSLNAATVATLQTLAGSTTGSAGAIALKMIRFNGLASTAHLVFPVGCARELSGAASRPAGKGTATKEEGMPIAPVRPFEQSLTALSAHPNPASEVVTFSYNFAATNGAITLTVRNAAGNTVARFPLAGTEGEVKWEVRALPAGTYFYSAADQNRTLEKGKVVILH